MLVLLGALVAITSAKSVSIIPHDAHPGYSIKQFEADPGMNSYRLLDSGFSQFFTMLEDGSVMTTSDLSPLVNRPINLMVLEETTNGTSTHNLQLYVLDRRNMLSFTTENYEDPGHIHENAPAGTRATGMPMLTAARGLVSLPVTYSIISGNSPQVFLLQDAVTNEISANITITNSSAGVYVVSSQPLDREERARYVLTIQAVDSRGVDKAITNIAIVVDDENDNRPIFSQRVYRFVVGDDSLEADNFTGKWKRFASVGKVEATDADGDKLAYRLVTPSNFLVIVPQTGEILLSEEPYEEMELELIVEAHDLRIPSLVSQRPAQILFTYSPPSPSKLIVDNSLDDLDEHHREKRRVTRAVRPTKRIEFSESDGNTEGHNVFQLEKETDRETFKIRDENPWVTVEPNGSVRVKKKWDYEELGPEKTIDFWVTITNAEKGGECFAWLLSLYINEKCCVTNSHDFPLPHVAL